MELLVNSPHVLKIGKLNFTEELFGKLYYPELYKDKSAKQETTEERLNNPSIPTDDDPWTAVPEEVRTHVQKLVSQ